MLPGRSSCEPTLYITVTLTTGAEWLGQITTRIPFFRSVWWVVTRGIEEVVCCNGEGSKLRHMDILRFLEELIAIDSPSGFTDKAAEYISGSLRELGYQPELTRKGAVRCSLGDKPKLALAAHTDTLGAIVSVINDDGTLQFSQLGGPVLPSFESAYVRVHTMKGEVIPGTLLLNDPSSHANNKAGTTERTIHSMHIRLDATVVDADAVKGLGIRVGDIIAVDPRYQALDNGYIKSHFLDNKAGCAVLYGFAQRASRQGKPLPVELFFSTYEEVGHGGAPSMTESVEELLVVDMGVVGELCQGNELSCSICAKDSGGPYDYSMRSKLVTIAEEHKIPYALDVYPYYSSDGTAALRAGCDVRVALIGPGVHASHAMERTNVLAINATIDLAWLYADIHTG